MKKRVVLTLPLLFLLFAPLLTIPISYSQTIVFQDGFNIVADSALKWSSCGSTIQHNTGLVYEGNASYRITNVDNIRDTFHPRYATISIDTSLNDYNITGYMYENIAEVDSQRYISLDTTTPCDTNFGYGMIGTRDNFETTNFVYNVAGFTDSGIARTTGWHKITYLIERENSTHNQLTGSIDDIQLFQIFRTDVFTLYVQLHDAMILVGTAYNWYDLVTVSTYELPPIPPSGEGWSIVDEDIPVGGYPTNDTDEINNILDDAGNNVDDESNSTPNRNNTSLNGIENTTDTTIGDFNFTETPRTLFYQFAVPRQNNTDIAYAQKLTVILGENYTGKMSLGFYVASNLESLKFKPVSDLNPAYLVKSRSWSNPEKGMYWVDLDGYSLIYGQVVAIAISGDSAGLRINETTNIRELYAVDGFRPFTITSNYDLFDVNGDIALWTELRYKIIVDSSGSQADEGQEVIVTFDAGESSLMDNIQYIRSQLGMGDLASGIFIGMMITLIFLFLTAYIGAKLEQQLHSFIYVGVFLVATSLNTTLGFYPVYIMVLMIFVIAIISASILRNLQSGSAM